MLKVHPTLAALFTTLMMTAAAPAFADYDDYLYQKNQSQYISHEQAAQAAVAQVTGGQAGDVDFEYNPWRGAHFDVEVYGQNGEYDVVVDAKTGKVLSVRRDY